MSCRKCGNRIEIGFIVITKPTHLKTSAHLVQIQFIAKNWRWLQTFQFRGKIKAALFVNIIKRLNAKSVTRSKNKVISNIVERKSPHSDKMVYTIGSPFEV